MLFNVRSAAAVALATAGFVSAQTFSECNPIKGDKCPADPALGSTIEIDFTAGKSDFFTLAAGTTLTYDANNGAVFKIEKEGQAPTITSKEYIFFGKVDVWVQASVGTGVVTSFVLQSDDLDEIDWEWLGGDAAQVQTNYFSKGDTTTYDRGGYSPVANPQTTFHKYTIEWTPTQLQWIIDDTVVRTLTRDAAKGGSTYPQTPMQIKLGTWVAGGKDAPAGTVQWAGGYTNFADAPFTGFYKKVVITDYAGTSGPASASSYEYSDTTGTAGSIKVNGGDGKGGSKGSTGSSSSSGSSTSSKASSNTAVSSSGSGSQTTFSTASATGSSSSTSVTDLSTSATNSVGAAAVSPGASATNAPKNAAGKVALTAGNLVVMGAAALFGSLFL